MDKLAKLASYAAGKNVGIWVWVRWSDVNNPANDWENMRRFFSSLSKTGIRGIKIDFMDSASQERLDFYDAVAENLAKNKLMVNFHGANTPTGEERSWPHEMSREGIYGGEQNIWAAIGGQHYCALPFTRLVSGHTDFTGGYFGHGPKLRGSSWTLQMAANIIYTSPMLHWVSNPADMEAAFPKDSPEREVVRNIPSVWEETIVLPPSAIGEYAAFARRSGNQWYIALMNGDGKERTVSIPLNFLDKNTAYQATILRDLAEKMTDGAWKPGKSLPEMPFPSPCASKAEESSAWLPPERGILPQAGKKSPPLLPSSKAERRKTMFIRRYTARLEKRVKNSALSALPVRTLLPGAPRRKPAHLPEAVAAFQKSAVQAGEMRRSVKDAYSAHPLAAPTVKHFHALGISFFQNHGILQTIRSIGHHAHQLILQPRFIAGQEIRHQS